MHTRRPRRAVGIGALLALLVTALMAGGAAVASAASATAPASGSATACALPEPTDDDTISVLGRICDRRESPQNEPFEHLSPPRKQDDSAPAIVTVGDK